MQMGAAHSYLDSGQSVRLCESILYLTIRQLWLRNAQWIQCVELINTTYELIANS